MEDNGWGSDEFVSSNNTGSPLSEEEALAECKSPAEVHGGGGSIAERRAATCEFHVPRINTSPRLCYRPLLSLPDSPMAYITIPAGISPTALLNSPIMSPDSQPLMDFEFPIDFPKGVTENHATEASDSINVFKGMILNADCLASPCSHTDKGDNHTHQHREPIQGEDAKVHNLQKGDPQGTCPSMGVRNLDDGYHWRKYGQKKVKGSPYPRRYYKCTHPNCFVKKMLECSDDGKTTEIVYKGAHNHPKVRPYQPSTLESSFMYDEISNTSEANGSCVEELALRKNFRAWFKKNKDDLDWRNFQTEIFDLVSNSKAQSRVLFESVGTPELSSTLASHDKDGATKGSISLGDDVDDKGSQSKRRKINISYVKTDLALRPLQKPRVVVQIESEVEKVDDGYCWRKYGQKAVKGNTNPRSYYKCTSIGCSVRKHVEKAHYNPKFIIITYEGTHNHEVLGSTNSSHRNLGGGSGGKLSQAAASSTQPTPVLPRNANAEITQNLALGGERIPDLGSAFLSSSLPGHFTSDINFEASSACQVAFPFSYIPMPYVPCGQDLSMALPMTYIPRSASNMELGGFNLYDHGFPTGFVEDFFREQQLMESDTTLIT